MLGLWLHGDDGMLHPRCWFYDMLKRRITDDNVTYYATYYHVNDYHVTWELELHLQISTNHRGIWWSKEGEVFRIFPSIVALRWKEMAICHFSWMVKCIKRRLFQRKKSPDGDSMFAQPLGCWLQQDDGAPQFQTPQRGRRSCLAQWAEENERLREDWWQRLGQRLLQLVGES